MAKQGTSEVDAECLQVEVAMKSEQPETLKQFKSEKSEWVEEEVSACRHVLIFVAHWFGSAQFDPHKRKVRRNDIKSQFGHTQPHVLKAQKTMRQHLVKRSKSQLDKGQSAVWQSSAGDGADAPGQPSIRSAGSGTELPEKDKPQVTDVGFRQWLAEWKLDMDGDGKIDLADFDLMIQNHVSEGMAEEDELFSAGHLPIFIVLETLVVAFMWLGFAVAKGGSNWTTTLGGLDSIFPMKTSVIYHTDCVGHQWEAWRWLTYQWTHGGLTHAGMNSVLNILVGPPLEGFHGHFRIIAVFNLGVFAGSMFHMAYEGHAVALVGCSAGCYSLLGMHMGDVFLNWSETRYRFPKLLILLVLIIIDIINVQLATSSSTSHAAHLGGYITGLCAGAILGRNLVWRFHERVVQGVLLVLWVAAIIFCLCWISQWAPRTFSDPVPWCWARQVVNLGKFGDRNYHCVRCATQDCINSWNRSQAVLPVDWNACTKVGWAASG